MFRSRNAEVSLSVAVLIVISLLCGPVHAQYSGGTGEPNEPYQIATAADLIALGNEPNDYDKHFILTADIDLDPNLPGRRMFESAVIAPTTPRISFAFTGVFDGNDHTISHLTITGGNSLGLFGLLAMDGEIRNLGILDVNIVGSGSDVGGLVGSNNGAVTECHTTGVVSATGFRIGGLVGSNLGAVSRCYSTAAVSNGLVYVGGLVGYNLGGTVNQCYSTGTVSGESYAGGLAGANDFGTVKQCYSMGVVEGQDSAGGLMGANIGGTLSHCYCTGAVSYGLFPSFDWLRERASGTISAFFWDDRTSGHTIGGFGTAKSTAEMQTESTFTNAGWDFVGETANGTEDVWKIAEGLDYPRLWWEPYDGRITLELGQVFAVTLESNPSTGYRWEWVDGQGSILEQIGEAESKPRETGDPPLVGAGGWEVFNFKAADPGQMVLQLVYRRPWEEGVEPLRTFSLQVVVPQAGLDSMDSFGTTSRMPQSQGGERGHILN